MSCGKISSAVAETYSSATPVLWEHSTRLEDRFSHEENLPSWEFLVARSGKEGAEWVAGYFDAGCDELRFRMWEAVSLLRSHRLEAAREKLAAAQEQVQGLDTGHPDRRAVLRRFFLSANAYYRYLNADYTGATEDTNGAQEAVEAAIRLQPLLLPLAHHCIEFQFLHARIARAQRRWSELRHHVEQILGLANDRFPLCRYGDDEPLYLSTLYRYVLALPLLTAGERERLEQLVARQTFRETWNPLVLQIYAVPGMVIPYP